MILVFFKVECFRVDDDGNSSVYISEDEGGSYDEYRIVEELEFVVLDDEFKN